MIHIATDNRRYSDDISRIKEMRNGNQENHESRGCRKIWPAIGRERSTSPDAGPGQALIEIFATGVCHTDLHAADGDWPIKPTPPFIPGHEGAGIVVALGPGVTHLKEGDRVGTAWLFSACGHCDYCLAGWETLCPEQQNSGYSVNGSFAEYAWAKRIIWVAFPRIFPSWMSRPSSARASPPIKD